LDEEKKKLQHNYKQKEKQYQVGIKTREVENRKIEETTDI
jgi:hypothetical protein